MYYQFKEYLKLYEGGKAFENIKVFSSEDKSLILEKVKDFLSLLGYGKGDYEIVGSFDIKKENINDIDIVLYDKEFDFEEIDETYKNVEMLSKKIESKGFDILKKFKTIGLVSVKLEIEPKSFIQMDIFPVPSLEWGIWSYNSPSEFESEYKGLYRNLLLEAIAKVIHFNIVKYKKSEETDVVKEGDIKSYFRYRYIVNSGLWEVKEENKGKSVINYEKVKDTYKRITNDPDTIIKILLGKGKSKDYMTFESIFEVISDSDWENAEYLDEILEAFRVLIEERNNFEMPSEVKKLL